MESLSSSSTIVSSTSSLPIFPSNPKKRFLRFLMSSSKNNSNNESEIRSNPNELKITPLSKDAAMGIFMSAASVGGWTTGSGMEGPPVPAGGSSMEEISTFPWSLFTKSPRRRMRVAFTCNVCGQRTTRAINPHAYTDGTVFVQCCGCSVFHKLVDNLNLFHEMKCYVNPNFNYIDPKWDGKFKYLDNDDGNNDVFPI